MNKILKLPLFILLISYGISYGQNDFRNGYIITVKNDTLQGQVDYRSNLKNYESCIFKSEKGITEYYPNQILGFGYLNDKFFSSQITEGSFVEVLIVGQMSLYKSKDKYLVKKDSLLIDLHSNIQKIIIDGKMAAVEKSRWRGNLSYLLSDCLKNSSSLTSNIILKEKNLAKLIIKYNSCKGSEYKEYKANKPWTKFEFGATIGVSKSDIRTANKPAAYSYLSDSYNSIDPSIGVLFAIYAPRIMEKIALQGELHYSKSSFSDLVRLDGIRTKFHDTYIKLTRLSIPLSVKYSFPEKKYCFYIQGGINYDYHLSSETRLLSEEVYGSVVNTYPERTIDIDDNQLGYWAGIGILKTYGKFKGSIAIRYIQMPAIIGNSVFTARRNQISLNLILFK